MVLIKKHKLLCVCLLLSYLVHIRIFLMIGNTDVSNNLFGTQSQKNIVPHFVLHELALPTEFANPNSQKHKHNQAIYDAPL